MDASVCDALMMRSYDILVRREALTRVPIDVCEGA